MPLLSFRSLPDVLARVEWINIIAEKSPSRVLPEPGRCRITGCGRRWTLHENNRRDIVDRYSPGGQQKENNTSPYAIFASRHPKVPFTDLPRSSSSPLSSFRPVFGSISFFWDAPPPYMSVHLRSDFCSAHWIISPLNVRGKMVSLPEDFDLPNPRFSVSTT